MQNPFLRHRSDTVLLLLVAGLTLFGVVMIYSASVVVGHISFGDGRYFVRRQIIWAIIGFLGLLTSSGLDYKSWQKWSAYMLGATFLLLLSIFVLSKGEINGAHRWITVAGQSFQPSELAKLTLIFYLSGWLANRERDIKNLKATFLPFIVVVILISWLMLAQPDFGTLTIILASAVAIYFAAGMTWQQMALGGLVAILGLAAVAVSSPYRRDRVMTFFNPHADTSAKSYHVYNIGIAVGSGGVWGLGFGESRQKRGFLPEPQTDSIFAVITEELGSLRSVWLILAFALLSQRGYRIASLAPDRYGQLLATGITSWFAFQAFINLAAMLQIVPLVGVPLPFVSYGGTNLVISMFAVGILLNISKYSGKPQANLPNRRATRKVRPA